MTAVETMQMLNRKTGLFRPTEIGVSYGSSYKPYQPNRDNFGSGFNNKVSPSLVKSLSSGVAKPVQIISQNSSGRGLSNNSYGVFGGNSEYTDLLNRIESVSNANTAKSAQLAAEQRDWQAQQNKVAMDFNASEAQKNRDWQQMMSNTAHQREIADLQAAGLNPVLSATGGNGAAVTSGATASGVTSSGSKGDVDTTFAVALMNFLGNMMGYATSTASAGINAGAVLGAAQTSANASMVNTALSSARSLEGTRYSSDKSYAANYDKVTKGSTVYQIPGLVYQILSGLFK